MADDIISFIFICHFVICNIFIFTMLCKVLYFNIVTPNKVNQSMWFAMIPYTMHAHLCCVLAGSVRSRKHWLWDIARKRNEFPLFSVVLRILHLLIALRTTEPIQMGFSANCTTPKENFNQIEHWKCHMCELRIISPDRITYRHAPSLYIYKYMVLVCGC